MDKIQNKVIAQSVFLNKRRQQSDKFGLYAGKGNTKLPYSVTRRK
jgi:hypothetical protein